MGAAALRLAEPATITEYDGHLRRHLARPESDTRPGVAQGGESGGGSGVVACPVQTPGGVRVSRPAIGLNDHAELLVQHIAVLGLLAPPGPHLPHAGRQTVRAFHTGQVMPLKARQDPSDMSPRATRISPRQRSLPLPAIVFRNAAGVVNRPPQAKQSQSKASSKLAADPARSSTVSSRRVRGGRRTGWITCSARRDRCRTTPGMSATCRHAGTVRWMAPDGRGIMPSASAAVRWLSIAPLPAFKTAAHISAVRASGPLKIAYTPGYSRCHLPLSRREEMRSRLTPDASNCARVRTPSCMTAVSRSIGANGSDMRLPCQPGLTFRKHGSAGSINFHDRG
jgi:hypothetical protein